MLSRFCLRCTTPIPHNHDYITVCDTCKEPVAPPSKWCAWGFHDWRVLPVKDAHMVPGQNHQICKRCGLCRWWCWITKWTKCTPAKLAKYYHFTPPAIFDRLPKHLKNK